MKVRACAVAQIAAETARLAAASAARVARRRCVLRRALNS
jgi:hypothetical protein